MRAVGVLIALNCLAALATEPTPTPPEVKSAKPKYSCKAWREARAKIRYVPYVSDGKLRGYVVHDLDKNSIMAKEGLQELDLIEAVDGVDLRQGADLKALLEKRCQQPHPVGEFTVLRSGKYFWIVVPLVDYRS